MALVIPLVVVVLLVAGLVTLLVLNATKKRGPAADDAGVPGVGADESPLGDTTEHAGEQSTEGTTVGRQDADEAGGTGRPVHAGRADGRDPGDPEKAAHVARPGEAEGREQLDFDGERPAARERS
jgi:hypothetical protein